MFDKIIMNPPYKGDLHLKILKETLKHANKTFECVNLSPILWLENPIIDDFDKSFLRGKLHSLEVITKETAQQLFIRNPTDLGIYHIKEKGNFIPNRFHLRGYFQLEVQSVFDKVKQKMPTNFSLHISDRDTPLRNYCVIYSHMSGLNKNHDFIYTNGVAPNGKTYRENVKNQHKNETSTHFRFDSLEEAENFREYLHTNFFIFWEKITQPSLLRFLEIIPYMLNYKQKWDDNNLDKFFEITKQERKVINDIVRGD